jgi:protein-tyrosine phosphatase
MVDLHCHVLPAIDDGSESLDQSLEFCRVALSDGVTTLVATPHQKPGSFENPPEAIRLKLADLRAALTESEIGVEIVEGAEVYYTPDLPERIRAKSVTTIGGAGRYLLLELSYQQSPIRLEEAVFEMRLAGVTPVLAHPERIAWLLADFERVERLVRLGCLTQLTGSSILGRFGERARNYATRMLEGNLAHVISSDAHDPIYRPPVLSEAREAAAQIVGAERAAEMVAAVPRAIARGEEWEPWPSSSEPEPAPPGLLDRIRGIFQGGE